MKFLYRLIIISFILSTSLIAKEKLDTFYNEVELNHIYMGTLSGSAWMYRLKYNSPACIGFTYGLGYYVSGDSSLSVYSLNPTSDIDGGIYIGNSSNLKALNMIMGEAYINFKKGALNIRHGLGKFDTPMTKNLYFNIPNFYDYTVFRSKHIKKTEIEMAQIRSMSYGSRAYSDYSLIGGNSTSAGASSLATTNRDTFINIGTISGNSASTYGLFMIGLKSSIIGYTQLSIYDYYSNHFINSTYIQSLSRIPFGEDFRAVIGVQGLYQKGLGRTEFDSSFSDFAAMSYGTKLGYELRKGNGGVYISYTKTGNNSIFNSWGGDPLYTSTMFVRNSYRGNVHGIKLESNYIVRSNDWLNGTMFDIAYGYYTQSNFATANSNGYGADFIVGYEVDDATYIKFISNIFKNELDVTDKNQQIYRVLIGYRFE